MAISAKAAKETNLRVYQSFKDIETSETLLHLTANAEPTPHLDKAASTPTLIMFLLTRTTIKFASLKVDHPISKYINNPRHSQDLTLHKYGLILFQDTQETALIYRVMEAAKPHLNLSQVLEPLETRLRFIIAHFLQIMSCERAINTILGQAIQKASLLYLKQVELIERYPEYIKRAPPPGIAAIPGSFTNPLIIKLAQQLFSEQAPETSASTEKKDRKKEVAPTIQPFTPSMVLSLPLIRLYTSSPEREVKILGEMLAHKRLFKIFMTELVALATSLVKIQASYRYLCRGRKILPEKLHNAHVPFSENLAPLWAQIRHFSQCVGFEKREYTPTLPTAEGPQFISKVAEGLERQNQRYSTLWKLFKDGAPKMTPESSLKGILHFPYPEPSELVAPSVHPKNKLPNPALFKKMSPLDFRADYSSPPKKNPELPLPSQTKKGPSRAGAGCAEATPSPTLTPDLLEEIVSSNAFSWTLELFRVYRWDEATPEDEGADSVWATDEYKHVTRAKTRRKIIDEHTPPAALRPFVGSLYSTRVEGEAPGNYCYQIPALLNGKPVLYQYAFYTEGRKPVLYHRWRKTVNPLELLQTFSLAPALRDAVFPTPAEGMKGMKRKIKKEEDSNITVNPDQNSVTIKCGKNSITLFKCL